MIKIVCGVMDLALDPQRVVAGLLRTKSRGPMEVRGRNCVDVVVCVGLALVLFLAFSYLPLLTYLARVNVKGRAFVDGWRCIGEVQRQRPEIHDLSALFGFSCNVWRIPVTAPKTLYSMLREMSFHRRRICNGTFGYCRGGDGDALAHFLKRAD